MMSKFGIFIIVALTFCKPVLSNSLSTEQYFFVPRDAYNTKHGPNPNGRQTSYDVKGKYPALGLSEDWDKEAKVKGWQACSGDALNRWRASKNETSSVPQITYQYMSIIAKSDEAKVIIAQYDSRPTNRVGPSDLPATDVQHVVVIEVKGTRDNIDLVKRIHGAKCQ